MNRTVGENGTIEVSTDPVRSVLFQAALILAVLLAGGLWAFRSMTRREIAASAALLILPMLALADSIEVMKIMDELREQWGLIYPQEKEQ